MLRLLVRGFLILPALCTLGCGAARDAGPQRAQDLPTRPPTPARFEKFDRHVPGLLDQYLVAGVGIGVIENRRLAWSGFYGEQEPGKAAGPTTVWNTASVAKTLTAEVLLALASEGLISLDEPIAPHVDHPDLGNDPRYGLLTPRLLLAHRSGLRNWPYEYEGGRARFIATPGNAFSYSGMGIELAAQFAENKLEQDFEALARAHVLGPLGITAAELSLGRLRPELRGRLARPMDRDGVYLSLDESGGRLAGARDNGPWSGADDLLTTVDAYARFMVGAMENRWVDAERAAERNTLETSLADNEMWGCPEEGQVQCAERFGHSVGWMLYEWPDHTILKHGGNDAGENALALYSPESGSGVVIFVNGGNGIFVSTQILGLLGAYPDLTAYYRR
ncbi:MAG: serine hydrolase domain-containing protein, partial [Acidobacteriota bacterium]